MEHLELLPWTEVNDLKLVVRKSDHLVHFEFFSTDRHFFRIPIMNVVSLDSRFGVSMPMTSNFTLYLWPFHLRKHLKRSNRFD